MRSGSHENLNHILNIIIGISIGLLIGYVIYDIWKLNVDTEFYNAQVMSLSFFIIIHGIFTISVLLICIFIKVFIRKNRSY